MNVERLFGGERKKKRIAKGKIHAGSEINGVAMLTFLLSLGAMGKYRGFVVPEIFLLILPSTSEISTREQMGQYNNN